MWEGDPMSGNDEVRDGVPLTNLDQPLFDGADATKRDLVDYLDAVRDRLLPELRDRPLSVIRVLRGQAPFMQKNVPKYTPEWDGFRLALAAAQLSRAALAEAGLSGAVKTSGAKGLHVFVPLAAATAEE